MRTLPRAVSEKSAIFFWLPAPYCKITLVLCRSICSAKSSTIFCSSGVSSTFICALAASATCVSLMGAASCFGVPKGSSVKVGACFNIASKSLIFCLSFCRPGGSLIIYVKIRVPHGFSRFPADNSSPLIARLCVSQAYSPTLRSPSLPRLLPPFLLSLFQHGR